MILSIRSLAFFLLMTLVGGIDLVYMGTTCDTSPAQTTQILSTTSRVAFEFQASASSDVSVQTLSMCLGGGSYTGTFTVALHSTATTSPYYPTSVISSSLTNSVTITTTYPSAMKTLTLSTPFTIPAGSTRYAIVVTQTGSTTVRWASVQTASVWTWPVLRQVLPCTNPCKFKYGSSAWSANSASLGFNLGGVVVPSPSSTPSTTPSPTPSKTPCGAGPGYYCSSSGSYLVCPIGSYCPLSSLNPALCPAGTYGSTSGLSTPACSGSCSAAPGFFCPPGSTSPTQTIPCPVGAYCAGGSAENTPCYPATACPVVGLSSQPPCYWSVSTLAGSGISAPFANGLGTAASFYGPGGIALDTSNNLFIADAYNNKIRVLDPSGVVSSLAGSGAASFADGTGVSASFNSPYGGVAISPANGNVFCADTSNGRVRQITLAGFTSTFATGFMSPTGIAFDMADVLYIADANANCIKKITPLGVVSILAGTGSATPFVDGAGTTTATFSNPYGLAVTNGYVLVGDASNHRIRLIDPFGIVSTLAGSGLIGIADGMGSAASFNRPYHIAQFNSGLFFIADWQNNLVRLVTLSGTVTTLAGGASAGYKDGFVTYSLLNLPFGIAINSLGTTFLSDFGGNRIRQLTCVPCPASFYCSSGAPLICFPGSFCPFNSFNPTPCPPGTASSVTGASSNSTCLPCPPGSYSLGGATSCSLCPSGTYGATSGLTSSVCSGNCTFALPSYGCPPGSTSPTPIFCPIGHWCPGGDPAAAIPCYPATACPVMGLIAQPFCYWNVTTLAGNGIATSTNGQGTSATFNVPYGISADSNGFLYVTEYASHCIKVVTSSGFVSILSGSGSAAFADGAGVSASFNTPCGIATNSGSGIIYVADRINNRIRCLTTSGMTTTFAGNGGSTLWADGLGTSASFFRPHGLVVDSVGMVYVADTESHRIRKITPLGEVTTLAGTGTIGFSNGVGTSTVKFNHPVGIAVDSSFNIYIGDANNNLIRRITSDGLVSTFAGSGSATWADGTGTFASFNSPSMLVLDANGNILVADTINCRMRLISPFGLVSTIAGAPFASFLDGFGTASIFNFPIGISIVSSGVVYAGDAFNNRIRQLACVPCPASYYCASGAPVLCPLGALCPFNSFNFTNCSSGFYNPTLGASSNQSCIVCPINSYCPTPGLSNPIPCPCSSGCTTTGLIFPPTCSPSGSLSSSLSPKVTVSSTLCPTSSLCPSSTPTPTLSRTASGATTLTRSPSTSRTFSNPGTSSPCPSPTYSSSTSPSLTRSPSRSSSTSPTAFVCPLGYYCMQGGSVVLPCPSGTWGGVTGLTSPACSGNCSAPPGYHCPAGSTTPSSILLCPVGHWCPGGSPAVIIPCTFMSACPLVGLSAQPLCHWNVTTLAGSGAPGWADGQGTVAMFKGPVGVSVHPVTQDIYVGDFDQHRVRRVTPTGLVSTFAGSGTAAFANGLGTVASFNSLHEIAVDDFGVVYVADAWNHRVRKIISSGLVSTLAGSGTPGNANGFGTAAQFNYPTGITIDSSGMIGYIVDQIGHMIRSVVLTTGAVTRVAGSGLAGFLDNANGLVAKFDGPTGIVWHPSGVLYIADGWGNCLNCGNNRVRSIFVSTTAVSTLAGSGAFGGMDGVGTFATFNQPRGITLDPSLTMLYVSEMSGQRIRTILLSSALVQTIAGSGAASFSDGLGLSAAFSYPLSLSFSSSGVLFAADLANNRIRQLTCVPCPASYYCSSGAPVICPSGSFCPMNSINATQCPSGSYNPSPGASSISSCALCPLGTYGITEGATSSSACNSCPAGVFGATPGLANSTCSGNAMAPPGYYNPGGSSVSTNATLCLVSYFCPGGTPGVLLPCSPPNACLTLGLSAQPTQTITPSSIPSKCSSSTLTSTGGGGGSSSGSPFVTPIESLSPIPSSSRAPTYTPAPTTWLATPTPPPSLCTSASDTPSVSSAPTTQVASSTVSATTPVTVSVSPIPTSGASSSSPLPPTGSASTQVTLSQTPLPTSGLSSASGSPSTTPTLSISISGLSTPSPSSMLSATLSGTLTPTGLATTGLSSFTGSPSRLATFSNTPAITTGITTPSTALSSSELSSASSTLSPNPTTHLASSSSFPSSTVTLSATPNPTTGIFSNSPLPSHSVLASGTTTSALSGTTSLKPVHTVCGSASLPSTLSPSPCPSVSSSVSISASTSPSPLGSKCGSASPTHTVSLSSTSTASLSPWGTGTDTIVCTASGAASATTSISFCSSTSLSPRISASGLTSLGFTHSPTPCPSVSPSWGGNGGTYSLLSTTSPSYSGSDTPTPLVSLSGTGTLVSSQSPLPTPTVPPSLCASVSLSQSGCPTSSFSHSPTSTPSQGTTPSTHASLSSSFCPSSSSSTTPSACPSGTRSGGVGKGGGGGSSTSSPTHCPCPTPSPSSSISTLLTPSGSGLGTPSTLPSNSLSATGSWETHTPPPPPTPSSSLSSSPTFSLSFSHSHCATPTGSRSPLFSISPQPSFSMSHSASTTPSPLTTVSGSHSASPPISTPSLHLFSTPSLHFLSSPTPLLSPTSSPTAYLASATRFFPTVTEGGTQTTFASPSAPHSTNTPLLSSSGSISLSSSSTIGGVGGDGGGATSSPMSCSSATPTPQAPTASPLTGADSDAGGTGTGSPSSNPMTTLLPSLTSHPSISTSLTSLPTPTPARASISGMATPSIWSPTPTKGGGHNNNNRIKEASTFTSRPSPSNPLRTHSTTATIGAGKETRSPYLGVTRTVSQTPQQQGASITNPPSKSEGVARGSSGTSCSTAFSTPTTSIGGKRGGGSNSASPSASINTPTPFLSSTLNPSMSPVATLSPVLTGTPLEEGGVGGSTASSNETPSPHVSPSLAGISTPSPTPMASTTTGGEGSATAQPCTSATSTNGGVSATPPSSGNGGSDTPSSNGGGGHGSSTAHSTPTLPPSYSRRGVGGTSSSSPSLTPLAHTFTPPGIKGGQRGGSSHTPAPSPTITATAKGGSSTPRGRVEGASSSSSSVSTCPSKSPAPSPSPALSYPTDTVVPRSSIRGSESNWPSSSSSGSNSPPPHPTNANSTPSRVPSPATPTLSPSATTWKDSACATKWACTTATPKHTLLPSGVTQTAPSFSTSPSLSFFATIVPYSSGTQQSSPPPTSSAINGLGNLTEAPTILSSSATSPFSFLTQGPTASILPLLAVLLCISLCLLAAWKRKKKKGGEEREARHSNPLLAASPKAVRLGPLGRGGGGSVKGSLSPLKQHLAKEREMQWQENPLFQK